MDGRIGQAIEQGVTVVTASRRLARTLIRGYNAARQESGAKSWPAAPVLSWGNWIDSLWEQYLYGAGAPPVRLGPWQERVLWERVVGEAAESSGLLQAPGAASAAQEAWQLVLAWDLKAADLESEGGDDARAFAGWMRRFRRICRENGWISAAEATGLLASAADGFRLPARILLAGFDEITPRQQQLIEACERANCRIERLPAAPGEQAAKAVRVPFPDAATELLAAARWARFLLESGAPGSIAVVVPDLAARRKAVERIFRSVLQPASVLPGRAPSTIVNISAGEPLTAVPLTASALALLGLRPDGNDWKDISALLRDPYSGGAAAERSRRGLLDAALRREGAATLSLSHVRELSLVAGCPALERSLRGWLRAFEQAPSRQTAAGWSRTFTSLLDAAGWPGENSLSSSEYQAIKSWTELLSDFAASGVTLGETGPGAAVSMLRRMAAERIFQPETEDAPVQILGALEASGLRFDHLWVTGLHDEAWPAPARPNPFLPVRLQRAAGIPHSSPERELAFARSVTQRLLASAGDVVFSYPIREGDRDLAPSPLILGLRKSEPADLMLSDAPDFRALVFESREVEPLVDEQGPPVEDAARQRGGTRVFQFQAACPFRAFSELRLRTEALEDPEPGLAPAERGALVHRVLEEVWKELKSHAALCSRTDVPELIRSAASEAVYEVEAKRGAPLPERYAALERRRIEELVAGWLEIERARQPFEVVEPEGDRFIEVSGIRCKVKIDRVDRLPGGREVIIDYKTGKPSLAGWDTDRPDEPQLPIYSITHPNPLAGVLFAQLRPGETRFKGRVEGIEIQGADQVDLGEQLEAWRKVLERLGGEFRAGDAAPDPKKPAQNCRYCKLAILCRVTEDDVEEAE